MSLAEGTYLIHFSAEETVNYYAYGRDVGKAIATVSTSSRNNPTLWRVQKHPSSNTYTISAAEGTNGHWARSDHLDKVMFSSQSRGWTSHWRIVDIDSRGGLYGIASAEHEGIFVDFDERNDPDSFCYRSVQVQNRTNVPHWKFIPQ